jgi:hypothetical protein
VVVTKKLAIINNLIQNSRHINACGLSENTQCMSSKHTHATQSNSSFMGTVCNYTFHNIFNVKLNYVGACGSVGGWDIMHQAERSRVQIPIRSSDSFNWPNPSSHTMALGSIQTLTETGWPARKADNLTTICEPIVYKMWKPRCPTTLWASMACYRDSFTLLNYVIYCRCYKNYSKWQPTTWMHIWARHIIEMVGKTVPM